MPATFPSHAAAVLPLKLWRPTWFDGVALVVGAAMPDLWYVSGCCSSAQTFGHSWWGTVVTVPLTLMLSWLIRWAAPVVAAHLPSLGPLALRDYGVLRRNPHRWFVSAWSAWIGALSHVLWDHVTHASIEGTSLGLPALNAEVVDGVPWWMVVHLGSSIVGALVWLGLTLHIGRRHLLVQWHGPVPAVPLRPRRFWSVLAIVGLGLAVGAVALTWLDSRLVIVPFLPAVPRPSVLILRTAAALGAAIVFAVPAVRPALADETPERSAGRRDRVSGGQPSAAGSAPSDALIGEPGHDDQDEHAGP